MGFVIKESLKSTTISLLGAALGALAILLATKVFSVSEFGLQQSLTRNTTLVIYFIMMGFDYALLVLGQRYGPDNRKRAAFLQYSAWIPLLVFFAVLIPYVGLKDFILSKVQASDRSIIDQYYYAFPLITFFYLLLFWFNGFLRSVEKVTFVFFVNEIILRVIVLVLLIFVWLGWIDLKLYVWLFAASFVIPVLLVVWQTLKMPSFNLKKQETLSRSEKWKIFDFAFFHMMIVFTGVLPFQIDGFLFLHISNTGLQDIAIYSTSIYAVSILRTPLRVVGQNAIPTFTQNYDEGNLPKLRDLYIRSALNLQILTSLLSLLLFLNLPNIQELFNFWKPGYEMLSVVIPILLLGVFVELWCGLNFEILGVSKHYKLSFYLALGYFVLIVILFYLWIKDYEIVGAAWAFSISLIVFSIARVWAVAKLFDMLPLSKDSFKVLLALVFTFGVFYFIPHFLPAFWDLLIRTSLISILFVGICYYAKIGEDVPKIVNKLLSMIGIKKQ